MKLQTPNRHIYISPIIFGLVGLLLSIKLYHAPIGDFGNYFFGSKMLLDGVFEENAYEIHLFNIYIREHYLKPNLYLNYCPVPPITSLFFIPFSWINDIFFSKFLFNLFSILLFSWSFYRILNYLKLPYSKKFYVLIIIFFIPFYQNLIQGQSYLIFCALTFEIYRASQKNEVYKTAILLAIFINLKVFSIIILLYFFLNKNHKQLIVSVLVTFSMICISSIFFSKKLISEYYFNILPRLFQNEINDPFAIIYQSMDVFLRKIFIRDDALNPDVLIENRLLFSLLLGIFILVVYFLFLKIIQSAKNNFQKLALILFLGILTTGYGSTYSLILLLPFALVYAQSIPTLILLFISLSFPINILTNQAIFLQFPRLWCFLIIIFIIFETKNKLVIQSKIILFFVGIGILLKLLPNQKDNSEIVFKNHKELLNFDFSMINNQFSMSFFNQNGLQKFIPGMPIFLVATEDVSIKNNQVYFQNRQITFGNDNKLKAALTTNNEILYLSDMDRGVKFYTLRKIKVD